MNYKTLDICNICKETENLKIVNKLMCFLLTAFDIEGKDGCTAIREIFLIQCVIRMIR